jgi:hypothetical protein
MADVGGGIIQDYSFTYAWGVNPSAASGTALLDIVGGSGQPFGLGVGDYVVYSFGSVASFSGIITEVSEVQNFGSGRQQTFSIADNRIRLQYQWVFAAFNIEDPTVTNSEGRPVSPAAGSDSSSAGSNAATFAPVGGPAAPVAAGPTPEPASPWGQRRRYRHLLPQHWQSGIWTYTDEPLTTRQILNYAFNHSWGDFGFSRNYHSALDSVVLTGLDYTTGIRLSNLVAEINSKCGLDVKIEGARTLVWGRKGVGLPPLRDATCAPYSSGLSLSANDTGVRVVGERTRIQRLNIELEPDWKQAWNAFIDEAAWRREVAAVFSLPTATKADQLNLSAYARKVTVLQYAKAKNDTAFVDHRPFGRVSRNQLPAWVYIRELVYRSYRIPLSFSLHGVPLSSLELADSLLLATDVSGEGAAARQVYASDPTQYYPSAQASAIVRGQPLDLVNARDIRLFYRNATGDLRNEWTSAPDFEVDAIGKSIRFAVPTFIDGDPSEGKSIYLKINKGEGGGADLTSLVGQGSDYLDIVVPNPDFVIQPAQVKASFCFLLGRMFQDYGSGPRRGVVSSNGLDLHVLDMAGDSGSPAGTASISTGLLRLPGSGGNFRELLYHDGQGAMAKADTIADSAIQRQAVQASGGFTRHGVVGTPLTPVVDRITVAVNASSGITEQVEYTKARSSSGFFAENTLQRIQRTEEMFAGQDALKREIREYRMMAWLEKRGPVSRDESRRGLSDVFEKPVGGENPQVQRVKNHPAAAPSGGWKAGDLVWLDQAGVPTSSDGVFGGVLVCAPGQDAAELSLAYAGRVPVRVTPGLAVNSVLLASPGDRSASDSGSVTIGRLAHGEETPAAPSGELLAMVDLGGGGGGGAGPEFCPFGQIIPIPASDPPAMGIRGGVVHCGDQNWNLDAYPVDLTVAVDTLLWIEVSCAVNTDDDGDLLLPGVETGTQPTSWSTGAGYPPNSAPTAAAPSATVILPIGRLIVTLPAGSPAGTPGTATLLPAGCGNFTITHCAGTVGYVRS